MSMGENSVLINDSSQPTDTSKHLEDASQPIACLMNLLTQGPKLEHV